LGDGGLAAVADGTEDGDTAHGVGYHYVETMRYGVGVIQDRVQE